jgi:hypothetical protein
MSLRLGVIFVVAVIVCGMIITTASLLDRAVATDTIDETAGSFSILPPRW